jgi:polygalacturonase
MAIVQISKIQIRRGLNQDLPQLDAAEMGWSSDTQQLYIGNGLSTAPDYAPSQGVTEILTTHSNLLELIGLYTFQGSWGGYTVQTGISTASPITRTLQSKLDDVTDIRDFGAVGDGVTDSTGAINRAIQQIYSSVYLNITSATRRKINFPAGTYIVSGTILVPPYATFIGDGIESTIIKASSGTFPVFKTVDDQYNGTGVTKPRDVLIHDMTVSTGVTAVNVLSPVMQIDSCVGAKIENVRFSSNIGASSNLVYISDTIGLTRNIVFENCTFINGGSGVNAVPTAYGVSSIKINNSYFENLGNVGYSLSNTVVGFNSVNNFFGNVTTPRLTNANPTHTAVGDTSYSSSVTNVSGIILGRQNVGTTNTISVPTGSTITLGILASGSGKFDYQLDNGSAYRYGSVQFTVNGTAATYQDDYTETGTSLGGNLFINNAGYLSCSVSTASTFKYNLTQYF